MSAVAAKARPSVRKPPVVGARIAGERFDWTGHPIYQAGGASGEVSGWFWYRNRVTSQHSDWRQWKVTSDICGKFIYFSAVIDDFGDLVAVNT